MLRLFVISNWVVVVRNIITLLLYQGDCWREQYWQRNMDEQLQCTVTKFILRRIISTQSGKYSVSWSLHQLFVFICKCTILNINVQIIYRLFDCSVVLLPFVVSLKVGSITGVLVAPGYGGYQSTTPPPCYTTTTFAPTGYYTEDHNYYTTKALEYYTAANAAPS
jgi:hypothetical protein